MAPSVSEDEIDDLLYFARTGDIEEFDGLRKELCEREKISPSDLLQLARDDQSGNGIPHMAAANGHHLFLSSISTLLSVPFAQNPHMLTILNTQNKAGNTALHWAALNGHLEAVKVLLEQGADPTIINRRGHDAVFEAELNDKREVVEWVLKESEQLYDGTWDGEGQGEGVEVTGTGCRGEDTEMTEDSGVVEGKGQGENLACVEEKLGHLKMENVKAEN